MADNSLEVKITADVTSLQAKSAVAKAELTELNSSVKNLASQFVGASDEMKASLAPQLDAAAKKAAATKAELAALNAEMRRPPEQELGFFASLGERMEGATAQVEGLTEKFQGFSKLSAAVSEFVLAGLALEKVADAFKEVGELGEQLNQLSMKTGISVSALSGLRVVAIQSGTDMDTLSAGIARLATSMQTAVATPTSTAAAAFREMGVSVTNAAGQLRPMQDVLGEVSKKLADYQDGTAKAALVGDLFGQRAGQTLIPVLNELGEQGFQQATEKAQQLGVAMNQTSAEADEQFNASIKTSGLAMEGFRDTVVQAVIPGLTVLEQAFTSNAQGSSVLNAAEVTLADTFKGIIEVFTAVVTSISEITDGAVLLGQELGNVATIAVAVGEALSGNFGTAERMMKIASTSMVTDWNEAFSKMEASEKTFQDTHAALWDGYQPPKPGVEESGEADKPKEVAPTIDQAALNAGKVTKKKKTADQETQIEQEAASAQKQIQQSTYDSQVSQWDAEVAQGKMSKAQEIQAEIAAQQQMYEVQLAEAQKEAELTSLTPVQKAKALDEIEVMQAQHNAQMERLNTQLIDQQVQDAKKLADEQKQAAAKTQQAWQQAFQPISQAFDASINGILQGTETLKQAEAKAAQSITLSFIDAEAKKLTAYIASEPQILARGIATQMGLTTATEAGETARMSAKVTGDAQGRSLSLASGVAQINNDAMKAAAGAFSAVAGIPYIGPVLAPAAAAAAYTAVMGFEVLSAEGGMSIPAGINPLTQLHEKEMVLPASIAQPLLGMVSQGNASAGSGGDTYHLNFNNSVTSGSAGGGVSVDQVFAAMNAGVRSGLHSSGKYPALARAFRRG